MSDIKNEGILEHLRQVVKDGVDYLASVLALLQMRLTLHLLTVLGYIAVLGIALVMALGSFIFLNVAAGIWLTHYFNSGTKALLLLGGAYGFVALVAGSVVFRWIRRISS